MQVTQNVVVFCRRDGASKPKPVSLDTKTHFTQTLKRQKGDEEDGRSDSVNSAATIYTSCNLFLSKRWRFKTEAFTQKPKRKRRLGRLQNGIRVRLNFLSSCVEYVEFCAEYGAFSKSDDSFESGKERDNQSKKFIDLSEKSKNLATKKACKQNGKKT